MLQPECTIINYFYPSFVRIKINKDSIQNTRSASSGKTTFELTEVEGVQLSQNFAFQILSIAKVHPAIHLISNVFDFFKAGFWTNEQSAWDQVKENVLREITLGITDYHKNVLNADLRHMDSLIQDLATAKSNLTPENFRVKLLSARDELYNLRFKFDPTSFKDSITYDPTIVAALTKLSAYYLTVSRIIEGESVTSGQRVYHQNITDKFWDEISSAAVRTFYWALNERESFIRGNWAVDEITQEKGKHLKTFRTSTQACIYVYLGYYASEWKSQLKKNISGQF